MAESRRATPPAACATLDPGTAEFYRCALRTLVDNEVPFLVGGAYSLERYTGIARHTKDFDIFVRQRDCHRALRTLRIIGCTTDVTFTHWLGKAFRGDDFIDVIFSSGNGIAEVDDLWFEHAVDETVLDVPVQLCPPEETIWSKAFIMERERYDGADVAHLMRAVGRRLDWRRLLSRFDGYWRVLLAHLTLFGFIYPTDRTSIPAWVVRELASRLEHEAETSDEGPRVCRGTILSRGQYLVDVDQWGYRDGRLFDGRMSRREVAHWTAAIDGDAMH
ncbi:MAG: hypothetical protein HYR51_05575 [Candidatus Rokubacteria bacterium]|nr:hypothetical protein [Candidatus Rokubacteria bacterium]